MRSRDKFYGVDKEIHNFIRYGDREPDKVKPPNERSEDSKNRLNIQEYISDRLVVLLKDSKLSEKVIIDIIVEECLQNEVWAKTYKYLTEVSGKSLKEIYSGFVINKIKGKEAKSHDEGDER